MEITRKTLTDRINTLRSVGLKIKEIQVTRNDAFEFLSFRNNIHMDLPRETLFQGIPVKFKLHLKKSKIVLETVPLHDDA